MLKKTITLYAGNELTITGACSVYELPLSDGASQATFVQTVATTATLGPFATTKKYGTESEVDVDLAAAPALPVASGTYTPTLTNVSNIAASIASVCTYMRVGNVVTVSGNVSIDATAGATFTELDMSLPIASDLGAAADLGGAGALANVGGDSVPVKIHGNATDNLASFHLISPGTTAVVYSFIFQYRVI